MKRVDSNRELLLPSFLRHLDLGLLKHLLATPSTNQAGRHLMGSEKVLAQGPRIHEHIVCLHVRIYSSSKTFKDLLASSC